MNIIFPDGCDFEISEFYAYDRLKREFTFYVESSEYNMLYFHRMMCNHPTNKENYQLDLSPNFYNLFGSFITRIETPMNYTDTREGIKVTIMCDYVSPCNDLDLKTKKDNLLKYKLKLIDNFKKI